MIRSLISEIMLFRNFIFLGLFVFLTSLSSNSSANSNRCEALLLDTNQISFQVIEKIAENWMLPLPKSSEYARFKQQLPEAMRRELEDIGQWNDQQTNLPRIPVPVARLSENEVKSLAAPRQHFSLPSITKEGHLYYPEHVKKDEYGKPLSSEIFHVRMMAVKDKGSLDMILPREVEYLRPFLEKSWKLEEQRDPKNFKNRFAFIQVDASWVEADQNQPRPGKTTSQSADRRNRQGAHVDGFILEDFWKKVQQEDITYAASFGFNPEAKNQQGDAIPTEFFTVGFPISRGLSHQQARIAFDQIANQNYDQLFTFPTGIINRMSSRVVHRVGVAKEKTYRTFVKIKFTDEIFNQAENTINVDENLKPASIYKKWADQGVPLVSRKTLPLEGAIEPEDAPFFKTRRFLSDLLK